MKRRAIRESAKGFYTHDQLEAWAESANNSRGREIVVDNEAFVAVAVGDDQVVGLTNLVYRKGFDTIEGEIDQLYVDPTFAGRGVARALLVTVEALARSRGTARLQATASKRSEPVFAACGYRQLRREVTTFNGHDYDSAIMGNRIDVG